MVVLAVVTAAEATAQGRTHTVSFPAPDLDSGSSRSIQFCGRLVDVLLGLWEPDQPAYG